jgi:DHA1 family bicyclomycin/chloramphenicol resistance-like MFS transporter
MRIQPQSRWLVAILSAFVALGPLSTDMYLPALPAMIDAFDSTTAGVQLTISAYLTGFALFHLVCGPLSDRYGRKPIMVLGLCIFAIASVGCAFAQSIEQLIVWRFIQGIGACTGPTLGRAMVRDIYGPVKSAQAMAYMAAIMALAPVIAPTLGGWMLSWLPWSSIFWFLALYALLGIVVMGYCLPESLAEPQSLHPKTIAGNYLQLASSARYGAYVFAAACIYAGAFAFISGSSFVLINFMQVPPGQFGLWFMFIVVGYMLGNLFIGHFGHKMDAHALMLGGALLGLAAGLMMVVFCLAGIYHPLMIVIPVAFYTCAVGITMPNAMAQAMAPFPRMAGTASALMGFVQMAVAAVAGVVVGAFLIDEPLPMALTITACGGLSSLLFALLYVWSRRDGQAQR